MGLFALVSPEDIENESSLCPAQHVHRVSDGYVGPRKALIAEDLPPPTAILSSLDRSKDGTVDLEHCSRKEPYELLLVGGLLGETASSTMPWRSKVVRGQLAYSQGSGE